MNETNGTYGIDWANNHYSIDNGGDIDPTLVKNPTSSNGNLPPLGNDGVGSTLATELSNFLSAPQANALNRLAIIESQDKLLSGNLRMEAARTNLVMVNDVILLKELQQELIQGDEASKSWAEQNPGEPLPQVVEFARKEGFLDKYGSDFAKAAVQQTKNKILSWKNMYDDLKNNAQWFVAFWAQELANDIKQLQSQFSLQLSSSGTK